MTPRMISPKCDCAEHQPCPCDGTQCMLCANDPRHGSTNGYTNCKCRCEPCRAVNAAACHVAEERRKNSKLMPERAHGTPGGYGNWGCKCDPCKAAWTKDTQERRGRVKKGTTRVQQGVMAKPVRRTPNKQEVSHADIQP